LLFLVGLVEELGL